MENKTSKLSGTALNWAVAKCEGLLAFGFRKTDRFIIELSNGELEEFCPSTDWAQGGPIIEREGISINAHMDGFEWFARDYWGMNEHAAEKPLEAAMRCYVANKLGDTVEVPEELC